MSEPENIVAEDATTNPNPNPNPNPHKLTAMDNAALRHILDLPHHVRKKMRKYFALRITPQEFLKKLAQSHEFQDFFPLNPNDYYEVNYLYTSLDAVQDLADGKPGLTHANTSHLILSFRHAKDNDVRILLVANPRTVMLKAFCDSLPEFS